MKTHFNSPLIFPYGNTYTYHYNDSNKIIQFAVAETFKVSIAFKVDRQKNI